MSFIGNARELGRERFIVLGSLLGVVALAWLYLWWEAAQMAATPMATGDAMQAMAQPQTWQPHALVLTFLMWAIMMVGMMLPGAAPMILLFAAVNRKKREQGMTYVSTGAFAVGYLLAWTSFSLLATTAQWGLHEASLLSPMMASTSAVLGGLLFLAAGIYQWTPLKQVCLNHCRSPLAFILGHWRSGAKGALVMGLEHGAFCIGCCWFLMGLLFVLGVMNLLWVAVLTLLVLLEKMAPFGIWQTRLSGAVLTALGAGLLFAG